MTIWIGRDLNLPDIDWSLNTIKGHQYPTYINERFLDFQDDSCFVQFVTFPTRINNTLDIFATNQPSLVSSCNPITGIGDHDGVCLTLDVSIQYQKPAKCTIYLWNKTNFVIIRDVIHKFCSLFLVNNSVDSDIEVLWHEFKQKFTEVLNHLVPSKSSSTRHNQPWINTIIKRLCRRKQRYFNKTCDSGQQIDWDNYKKLKKYTQYTCKKAYESYIDNIVSTDINNNPKRFWSFVKCKRSDHCGVPSLEHEGCIYDDSSIKSNILNKYFASVFTTERLDNVPVMNESPYPCMTDITITLDGPGISLVTKS